MKRVLQLVGPLLVITVGLALLIPSTSSAHNREKTSTPENGAILTAAPPEVTFYFKQPITDDSATAFLLEPSGARTPLTVLSTSDQSIVVGVPPIPDGKYSVRWKLISSDGHPVTNKISFTVATGNNSETLATTPVSLSATPATATSPPSTELPATTTTSTPTSTSTDSTTALTAPATPTISVTTSSKLAAVTVSSGAEAGSDSGVESDLGLLPDWLRWILRFASYVSFMLLIGVVATGFFIWPEAIKLNAIRRIAFASLALVSALAFAQLAVLAHDIDPANWTGALRRTQSFDVGKALLARIVAGVLGFAVLRVMQPMSPQSGSPIGKNSLMGLEAKQNLGPSGIKSPLGQKLAIGGLCGFLAATWAASGHSLSQRWSALGVPLDTVHHLAAAGWLGSLLIVAAFVFRHTAQAHLASVMQRLSRFALLSVILIVVTGVWQSYRLIGGLSSSAFEVGHTQLLLVKLIGVAAMLIIANIHRKRVQKLSAATPPEQLANLFRRSLITEFVLGIAVLAVTASLVVSSPAIVETDRSAAKLNQPIPLFTN